MEAVDKLEHVGYCY